MYLEIPLFNPVYESRSESLKEKIMTKLFVLDTNVLLNDANAPKGFDGNTVVVPLAVLQELDNQKSRKNDLARDARAAVRALNSIIGESDPILGVEHDCGRLVLMPDQTPLVGGLFGTSNDDKIIDTVIALGENHGRENVTLITNDINMRLKAKAAGCISQEYRNDIIVVDSDLLPTGIVTVSDQWLNSIPTGAIKAKSCGVTEIMNHYIPEEVDHINTWITDESNTFLAVLRCIDNDEQISTFEFVNMGQFLKRSASSITPRNLKQSIMLDAILDSEIDIVVVDGAAGSGKTLMAMAGATELVKGKKTGNRMDSIIFTRSNDSSFEDIGFLPGNETEKMAPWVGAVFDNMEVIGRASKNEKFMPAKSINGDEDEAFIQLKAMLYFRGRSISHKVLIIDEAQNLTSHQMKTALTRAGEYCKVIVLGNLDQIDNPAVTDRSSGLTYAMNKLKCFEFAQVIQLDGGERSRLSAFVEQEF